MKTRKSILFAVLLMALIMSSKADFEDIITTVKSISTDPEQTGSSYRQGSMLGGTRLWIKGSGFSSASALSNRVLLGDILECEVIEFLTTNVMIVCETPPHDTEEGLQVKVYVDNDRIGTCDNCWFSYGWWATPSIRYITPNSISPSSHFFYYLRPLLTTTEDLDYLKIGDMRCNMEEYIEYSHYDLSKWGYNNVDCDVGSRMEAGHYSVTARSEKSTGNIDIESSVQTDGNDFTVIPRINSISSSSGSIEGNILTIRGQGFSSTKGNNVVKLGDTDCNIITETVANADQNLEEDVIVCELESRADTNLGVRGYHAGLIKEFWEDDSNFASIRDQSEDAADPDSTTYALTTDQGYAQTADHVSRLTGFFKAPHSGTYTFFSASDDYQEVYLNTDANTAERGDKIVVNNWTPYRDYFYYYRRGQQSSADYYENSPITLTADELYYLEIINRDGGGGNYGSVGVLIDGYESDNKVFEVREYEVVCPTQYETYTVTVRGSGSWRFRMQGVGEDYNIYYTDPIQQFASSGTVDSQITHKLGQTGIEVTADIDEDGNESVYTIVFTWARNKNQLEVTNQNGVSVSMSRVGASTELSGTYVMQNGGLSTEVSFSASASQFENALYEVGVSRYAEVDRIDDPKYGSKYIVQFHGDAGQSISLSFDKSGLSGCNGPISFSDEVIQAADEDSTFYYSIPTNMLFTAETTPQITIESNGIQGHCPGLNCDYTLIDENIPLVTSASYNTGNDELTIVLTGVEAGKAAGDFVVYLGIVSCITDSYTEGTGTLVVTCDSPTPEGGTFEPKVLLDGLGFCEVDTGVDVTITLDSTPSTTNINPNGGNILTITGEGFPVDYETAEGRLSVMIGDAECVISSVSTTEIVCETSAQGTGNTLTVSLNSVDSTTAMTYDAGSAPSITSVTPNEFSPVLETAVTIAGNNFDANIDDTVIYFSNSTHPNAYQCYPTTSTVNQIECTFIGAGSGDWDMIVKTSNGYSDTETVTVRTTLASLDVDEGSVAGGTTITLTGSGWSTNAQQTLVFIGPDNIKCAVESSSETEVVCVTGALVDDSQIGQALDVVVATRIVEESVCTGTCTFTYKSSLTPTVSAIEESSDAPGDEYEVTGTGFAAGTTVTVDGVEATVSDITSTSLTFALADDQEHTTDAAVVINVPDNGNALFDDGVSNTIDVGPFISASSPSTGGNQGTLLTVTGKRLTENTVVYVDQTECLKRSVSDTEIKCRASTGGSTNIADGDFTNIYCASGCWMSTNSDGVASLSSVSGDDPVTEVSYSSSNAPAGTFVAYLVNENDGMDNLEATSSDSSSSTFDDVHAGTYVFELYIDGKAAAINGNKKITQDLSVSNGGAVTSSLGGGVEITITGNGFYADDEDMNEVRVCGFRCPVTGSPTSTSLTCIAPQFQNEETISEYPNSFEVELLSGTWTGDKSDQIDNAYDGEYTTHYKSNSEECEIALTLADGLSAALTQVRYFPQIDSDAALLDGTKIEGCDDSGSNCDTIFTIDENAHDGWNSWDAEEDDYSNIYSVFKLSGVSGTTARCAIADIEFRGVYLSLNDETDLTDVNCKATVTVNGLSDTTSGNVVTYDQTVTGSLLEITPNLGTAVGGETITLTFEGSVSASGLKVFIDDVEQGTANLASATTIEFDTVAAPAVDVRRNSLASTIRIESDDGYVLSNGLQFLFIEKWSETATWGVLKPREGDSVSIPAGQAVLVDENPPKLNAVIVEGALIFDCSTTASELHFEAHYIFVRNGRFQIGTEEEPCERKVRITMHGEKDDAQLPDYGNKVIALREGIMDIHGIEKEYTWTVLDTTANAGDTSFTVQGLVDWEEGDIIVVASTSHDHYESEQLTISSVTVDGSNTIIGFEEELKYEHFAATKDYAGVTFNMRAEVGLLTRNIVIEGDELSEANQYGVHIMTFSPDGDDSSIGRISYTEIRQAGQAFNLGRYALHYHLVGNVHKSYVRGNSFHHTYNRAVTIHGVHYLPVQNNVAYWCKGHTIFIEDGIETHNLIEDNLVISTRKSEALLNTDQTPACFWITNPNNIWRRNHCAGSDRYGFWFDLRPHPEGPSFTTSVCPTGVELGVFEDNEAHSVGRYGLRLFHEMAPRKYPCRPVTDEDNEPIQAVFKDFLSWKNRRDAVIGERLGAVKFQNILSADMHRAGIEISKGDMAEAGLLQISGATIIGTSDNAGELQDYKDKAIRGIILPGRDNLYVEDVKFINFEEPEFAIFETCSHCEHPAATDSGARTSFVQGLSYSSVTSPKLRYNNPYRAIVVDQDGSLLEDGSDGAYITKAMPHLMDTCTHNSLSEDDFDDSVFCVDEILRRIVFTGLQRLSDFRANDMHVALVTDPEERSEISEDEYSSIYYRAKTNPADHWAFVAVAGQMYNVFWGAGIDFTNMQIITSDSVLKASDPTIVLLFNYTDTRETFKSFIGDQEISGVATMWTTEPARGTWHHNEDLQHVYLAVNAKTNSGAITFKGYNCLETCPKPGQKEYEDFWRYWSNASDWASGQVPAAGEDVTIPEGQKFKLDMQPEDIGKLTITGWLQLDGDYEETEDLDLRAESIWVQGIFRIGESSVRYTRGATITLTGEKESESINVGVGLDTGNNVLAVTGDLVLRGREISNIYCRLTESIEAGDTLLKLEGDISSWVENDTVLILPTERQWDAYEERSISEIDYDENTITLSRGVLHYHFGAEGPQVERDYGTLDMRAEVLHLTRNIKVQASSESHAGRLYFSEAIYEGEDEAGNIYGVPVRATANLDGVELINMGQEDTSRAGITFEKHRYRAVEPTVQLNSRINKVVVRESPGHNMLIRASRYIDVTNTVFYESTQHGVVVEDSTLGSSSDIIFTNNYVIGNQRRNIFLAESVVDFTSAIYVNSQVDNSDFSGNIFAGCEAECIAGFGGLCNANTPFSPVSNPLINNTAHSGFIGFLATSEDQSCLNIQGFVGYMLDVGIVTFFRTGKIEAHQNIISDTGKGVILNSGAFSTQTHSHTLSNSYIAAHTRNSNRFTRQCSENYGVYIAVSTNGAKTIPPSTSALPWRKVKTDALFVTNQYVNNIEFVNFDDTIVEGCEGNYVFKSNEYASDGSANLFTSALTLTNVSAENRIYFEQPKDSWIGVDDCGGWFCTGINNILVRDDDGTLAGDALPATYMPYQESVSGEGCVQSENENALVCNNTNWALLTFESGDIDTKDRLISPVNVTTEDGYRNDLNSYMDHVWDGFYTGLKRLSRFHAVVESDKQYNIQYTGTIPNVMRYQLTGAIDNTKFILFSKQYTKPQSIVVKANDVVIPVSRQDTDNTVTLGASNQCGAHTYDQENRIINVVLKGPDCKVTTELVNSVQGSVRYNVDLTEFFNQNGDATFVDKVAAVLGIDLTTIRVARIRQGSSILIFDHILRENGDEWASKAKAEEEGNEKVKRLQEAAENGELDINGFNLLDFNFEVTLKNYIEPESEEEKTNVGAIVGGVIGGIAALVIGFFVVRWLIKRKNKSGDESESEYESGSEYSEESEDPKKTANELRANPDHSSIQPLPNNNDYFIDQHVVPMQNGGDNNPIDMSADDDKTPKIPH